MQIVESQTSARLSRLERLIRLYESGQVSERMDRVLDKVFAQEAADTLAAIERLDADIGVYEGRYNLSSDEFLRKFQSGSLGDSMDYIEWSSLLLMREDLRQRLAVLVEDE